jgi:ketosteroid isomerase-like protein
MTLENVELVYQAADAFNLGLLSAFLALCSPNVQFISRLVPLKDGKPRRGHDGVRSWWEGLHRTYWDLSAEIDDVRNLGEVTVARVRLRGRARESDAPMQQTQWHVTRWRHKTAIRWRVCLSEDDALEAAGLRESGANIALSCRMD